MTGDVGGSVGVLVGNLNKSTEIHSSEKFVIIMTRPSNISFIISCSLIDLISEHLIIFSFKIFIDNLSSNVCNGK